MDTVVTRSYGRICSQSGFIPRDDAGSKQIRNWKKASWFFVGLLTSQLPDTITQIIGMFN